MTRMTTLDGSEVELDEATLQAFRSAVRGEVMTPDDDRYDEARGIFNGKIGRAHV